MASMSGEQDNGSYRIISLIKNLIGFSIFPSMAVAVILGAAVLGVVYFERIHRDRIYPGVVVWAVDLGGMEREEAGYAVADAFPYPDEPAFTFRDPGTGQSWVATPAQLGVTLDVKATVASAYQIGRADTLWDNLAAQADAYSHGRTLSPIVVLDDDAGIRFLEAIALEIYRPVLDAGIVFAEDRLIATPSQISRQMNLGAVYDQVATLLDAFAGAEIDLPIDETRPDISDEAVADVLEEAERLTGRPITVFLAESALESDPEPRTLTRAELVDLLVLELDQTASPPRYSIRLDEVALAAWLEPLVPVLETEPADARFVFDHETGELRVLENSTPSRKLNVPSTVQQILVQATSDNREIPLVIEWVKPVISEDATAEGLGITELVAQGTTLFTGSSAVRVHNVGIAASRFHGIVIPPGEVFSFNEYLGDVSEQTGFEEGLIIFGGRTIKGVGGGVCQVSTTAFQAAFYAGFPVLERHPHGYRVSYYEHGEGPGMDATVFYPDVDFLFENDTPHHLLIETYTNEAAQRLTFKFYSTSDGRVVEKGSTEISDVVPHPPDLYEEDPELALGEIKQVDWAADGANVRVERVLRAADGSLIREDTFLSHYLPWQAVYNYGPGTEGIPTPEPTVPPDPTATPSP